MEPQRIVHTERFRMKLRLLLWLFSPVVLSASDQEHFVNGTHEPVTKLNISEDLGYINPQDYTTTTMTPDFDDFGEEEYYVKIFLKDQRGLMTHVTTETFSDGVKLPDGIGGFLVRDITCLLTTELSCTWNALNEPQNAEYSVKIEQKSMPTTICNCDKTDGRVTGCHGNIQYHGNIQDQVLILHINVSCVNFWYIHSRNFDPDDIVKFNPPQNISVSVISGNLHIKWDPPTLIRDRCLRYQLRINKEDEPRNFSVDRSYTVPNVDLSKSYFVQMRVTKSETCTENNIWSDWSAAVEVPSPQKLLEPRVIVAIALGIPMFLLAVFLVFRCRSEMEKLFPVPSPSMKVKQLLEKDDYIQVLPAKYIEEVTEVLFVGNDECTKISE
ncbi:interleukin-5 receptor subunit alpha-like isoform X1 [Anguilla rostrata]|uniref:interleukin-5 receptor subunit alpha-like isoform X1 n=2 Tax=Anguilla rostrata TaxID=7938 RepID=UPI0030CD9D3E